MTAEPEGVRRYPYIRRPKGPREPPGITFTHEVRVRNRSVETQWEQLVATYANEARRCFDWLATTGGAPIPGRCGALKGPLSGLWQYEVGGGARVWFRRFPGAGRVVVVEVSVGHPKRTERPHRR